MTAHQLARLLLAGPDWPIYHFDPSRFGYSEEDDTSLSAPTLSRVDEVVPDNEGDLRHVRAIHIVGADHEDLFGPPGYEDSDEHSADVISLHNDTTTP